MEDIKQKYMFVTFETSQGKKNMTTCCCFSFFITSFFFFVTTKHVCNAHYIHINKKKKEKVRCAVKLSTSQEIGYYCNHKNLTTCIIAIHRPQDKPPSCFRQSIRRTTYDYYFQNVYIHIPI